MRHILETRRKALEALTERLIEKEVIDTAELKELIEQNSPSPMIVPGTGDDAETYFRRSGSRAGAQGKRGARWIVER